MLFAKIRSCVVDKWIQNTAFCSVLQWFVWFTFLDFFVSVITSASLALFSRQIAQPSIVEEMLVFLLYECVRTPYYFIRSILYIDCVCSLCVTHSSVCVTTLCGETSRNSLLEEIILSAECLRIARISLIFCLHLYRFQVLLWIFCGRQCNQS